MRRLLLDRPVTGAAASVVDAGRDARIEIRTPERRQAAEICSLIAPFAASGLMLSKSPEQIVPVLDRYRIAVVDGEVVGSVGWRPVSEDTVEIVALAVSPVLQGQGVGSRLIRAILDEAAREGVARVFALTLRPEVFERFGFRGGRISEVPEKIHLDCVHCPRRSACPEKMVILER